MKNVGLLIFVFQICESLSNETQESNFTRIKGKLANLAIPTILSFVKH